MAASSSSSSSISSEIEAERHPFEDPCTHTSKGAYHSYQSNNGFTIRVDMPGVPPSRVKLFKYTESRTVTFTGRAPKHWEFDSSERVYGGYVVLNTDPNNLDIEMTVKKGCLRLFFPDSEGVLHFFPSKEPTHQNPGSRMYYPCVDSSDDQSDGEANVFLGQVSRIGKHDVKCRCKCQGKKTFMCVTTPHSSYTNPALLQGAQGVWETKLVHNASGTHMYMRVDMPGIDEKSSGVMLCNEHYTVHMEDNRKKYYMMMVAFCPKERYFDKHPRSYLCSVVLQCNCCEIDDIIEEKKDGVFRILFRKKKKEMTTPIKAVRNLAV